MLDKKILALLKPIKRKIYFGKLINYIILSLLISSIISFLLMTISRFIPMTFIWEKFFIITVILLILGVIWSIYKRPSLQDSAEAVDKLGLKERVITSLELSGNSSNIAEIQKEDTVNFLKNHNYKEKIKIKSNKKFITVLLVLAVSTVLVGFIPSNSYLKVREIEENQKKAETAVEKIEKLEEKINEDKLLTEEDKLKIEKQLKDLKSKFKKPQELDELSKEMTKLQKKFENIKNDMKDRKIQEAGDKLAQNEFSKELGEALLNRESKKIDSAIEKMNNLIKTMDKERLKGLSQELEKILENLKQNPELAKKLEELAKSLSQGSTNNNLSINATLSELNEVISELIDNPQLPEVISEIEGELNSIDSLTESMLNQDGNSLEDSSDNNSGSNGSQGQGNQQGDGQGNGNQGQGQGQGTGDGSSNDNLKDNSNGNNQGGSKSPSQGEATDYQKIFTPQNINKEGHNTNIHDSADGHGESDVIQVKRFGDMPGQFLPYKEVLQIYKENAYNNLDNREIPPNMREIVKKYFSELE